MQTKSAAHISYYKYTLSALLIISAIFFSGDIFGSQDTAYLKKYFENAIFLYESGKYKESILLFEKIIEAENSEGKFYFTPFAEIYIEKSKDKNITLMPSQGKKPVKISSPIVSKKSDGELPGVKDGKEKTADNYDNKADYYANKRKTPPLIAAKPDNIKSKGAETEKALVSEEKKTIKIPEADPEKEKEALANADKIRLDLMNEKLEEGLENLDQDTLKSFDDERFVDIVKRIKQYKKGKRGK